MIDPGNNWPSWPEMTKQAGEYHPDNIVYKRDIMTKYGEKALRQSWNKVCYNLSLLTQEITKKQSSLIQEIQYDELATLSEETKDKLKKTGCFVIRKVIPRSTADEWFQSLQTYVVDNKNTITGLSICFPRLVVMCTILTSHFRMAGRNTIHFEAFLVSYTTSSSNSS